jgi:hypothetical protein
MKPHDTFALGSLADVIDETQKSSTLSKLVYPEEQEDEKQAKKTTKEYITKLSRKR